MPDKLSKKTNVLATSETRKKTSSEDEKKTAQFKKLIEVLAPTLRGLYYYDLQKKN